MVPFDFWEKLEACDIRQFAIFEQSKRKWFVIEWEDNSQSLVPIKKDKSYATSYRIKGSLIIGNRELSLNFDPVEEKNINQSKNNEDDFGEYGFGGDWWKTNKEQ
jgi:hypothetical protein